MAYPSNRFGRIDDQNSHGIAQCYWSFTVKECDYILNCLSQRCCITGPVFVTFCNEIALSWRLEFYPRGCGIGKGEDGSLEDNRIGVKLYDCAFEDTNYNIDTINALTVIQCQQSQPNPWHKAVLLPYNREQSYWGYCNTIPFDKIFDHYQTYHEKRNEKLNDNDIVFTIYCYIRVSSIVNNLKFKIYPTFDLKRASNKRRNMNDLSQIMHFGKRIVSNINNNNNNKDESVNEEKHCKEMGNDKDDCSELDKVIAQAAQQVAQQFENEQIAAAAAPAPNCENENNQNDNENGNNNENEEGINSCVDID